MTHAFLLPDLGEGLQEATITQWHIDSGDHVELDQVICSVETAKSLIDITAPCEAIIDVLHAKVGETLAVNTALFSYRKFDDDNVVRISPSISESTPTEKNVHFEQSPARLNDNQNFVPAVPLARKLAEQHGVDLQDVIQFSKKASVSVSCVESYLESYEKSKTPPSLQNFPIHDALKDHTHMAWREAVQTVAMDEFDITPWFKKFNVNWVMVQAICHLRKNSPKLFSKVASDGTHLTTDDAFHIALPVHRGSYTQIILLEHADQLTETDFLKILEDIKNDKTPTHKDYKQAHTILSNVGGFGGRFVTPLCIPPLLTTIAVGKTMLRPAIVNDSVLPRQLLPISISCDHRYIEGVELIAGFQTLGKFLISYGETG